MTYSYPRVTYSDPKVTYSREILMGVGNGVASVIMLTFPSEPCPHAHAQAAGCGWLSWLAKAVVGLF